MTHSANSAYRKTNDGKKNNINSVETGRKS